MHSWPVVEFQELAAEEPASFAIGPFGSRITKENYVPTGVPVVRGVNLSRGVFVDEEFVYISDEKADELGSSILMAGDLVFTHRGTIGQVSMIPQSPRFERYILSSSQVKARLNQKMAVPEFYYYWFRSPLGQQALLANASTVGVPGIASPLSTIRSIKVPLPARRVQQGVAEVLAALDEKIAVNERIAHCADALAFAMYRRIVGEMSSEEPAPLSALATVVLGGTPDRKNREFWIAGTVNWINSGKANDFRVISPSELITESALTRSAAKMMPAGATIVAITGATMGQVSRVEIPTSGNQSLVGVWSSDRPLNDWLYFWIRDHCEDLIKHGTGGAQQHINKAVVASLEVVRPSDDELWTWSESASPLLDLVAQRLKESEALASLGDELLPKLMSGAIRVRDAEKAVEEAT